MSTKEAEPPSELRCSECQSSLDWCAFCDETGCAVAICYGCMVVALGQTAPPPRTRGG